jgi:hypothetical protein
MPDLDFIEWPEFERWLSAQTEQGVVKAFYVICIELVKRGIFSPVKKEDYDKLTEISPELQTSMNMMESIWEGKQS